MSLPMLVKAYGIEKAGDFLHRLDIERRTLGPNDILIEIKYAGVCHSDIHTLRQEWGQTDLPMVVGHEIAGIVADVGSDVSDFKVGDRAGVGCLVNSCQHCHACESNLEQHCENGAIWTYNSTDKDGTTTLGGYSTHIVVNENFALHIPQSLPLDSTAPLLCAGITTYSPLKRFGAGPGKRVAVIGLGGLGHMAVKLAVAMGAEVSILSRSLNKQAEGKALGATSYYATSDQETFNQLANYFDLIINTVSAPLEVDSYLKLLRVNGTMVSVGMPPEPMNFHVNTLIHKNRTYAGSLIGGIAETQEMLDFCAQHKVSAEIETIAIQDINAAWDRVVAGDVKFRFVIDIATLANEE